MEHLTRDELAAYTLRALPARRDRAFRRHLVACASCRGCFERLAEAASALALALDRIEPPPALRDRILAAIRTDA